MGRMTSHILWKIKNVPNHQPVYDWSVGVELPDTNRYQWDNWRDDPLSGWQGVVPFSGCLHLIHEKIVTHNMIIQNLLY